MIGKRKVETYSDLSSILKGESKNLCIQNEYEFKWCELF